MSALLGAVGHDFKIAIINLAQVKNMVDSVVNEIKSMTTRIVTLRPLIYA